MIVLKKKKTGDFSFHVIGRAAQLPSRSAYKLLPKLGYSTKEQSDQTVYTGSDLKLELDIINHCKFIYAKLYRTYTKSSNNQ